MSFHLNVNAETVMQAHPVTPVCVPPDMTVRDVVVLMRQRNTGCVLICRRQALVGIFTQRDLLKLFATEADLGVSIETVMKSPPVTVKTTDTVAAAVHKMNAGGYRHLPIVDDAGQPVGLLKVRGIVHYLVEHFPRSVYTLPPEPRVVSQEREGA